MKLKEDKNMYEYSDEPELLRDLIKQIDINISVPKEVIKWKRYRNRFLVTIQRREEKISFHFYDSINNFIERKKPTMYDILACVNAEYYCPDNFNDFCAEYGYDEDSIKARETWKNCIAQSDKLKQIFSEEEIAVMPR